MPKGCPFREICPIYGGNYDPYNANIKSDYKKRYCEKYSLDELLQKGLCSVFDLVYGYLQFENIRKVAQAIAEEEHYKN